mmetsp:Transcript_4400/g.8690  ORF Transcript_4400/g.8690 Transcript_4400/m.8690 type:complete len:133 (-) Transcript_4400:1251-1649(-)
MRLSEYLNFRQSLRTRQDVEKAAQESQHSFETLFSIVSQTTSRHVRSHFKELVKKTPVFLHQYLRMNQSIVTIAKRAGFPPCDLARRICGDLLGLSSKSITKLLRNPQLIEDPRLRSEIMRCLAEVSVFLVF